MKKQKAIKAAAVTLGTVLCLGTASVFAGCTSSRDTLVVMTEELNGLFNPFYSTTGADMEVVGQTQISMLTTNSSGELSCGNDEPVVVLDYKQSYDANETGDPTSDETGVTTYYFVLKNGIKFSDGVPLTMNDVLFNMYVYLDPVYAGSSTMYSSDIVGLKSYRMQDNSSGATDDSLTTQASVAAKARIDQLLAVYHSFETTPNSKQYDAPVEDMKAKINTWTNFSEGYMGAISATPEKLTTADYQKQLLADYELVLEKFREELERDYVSAQSAYTEEPYKSHKEFEDPVLCFMYAENLSKNEFVEIKYPQKEGETEDKTKIESVKANYSTSVVKDKDSAIDYVFGIRVTTGLDDIFNYFATGSEIKTEYSSKATEVILQAKLEDGQLPYPNVEGVVSMGHSTNEETVTVNNTTYKIAHEHNEDGTPANANEYDVLRIKINGKDPKAIWNFSFTVAPYHYYSDPDVYTMDIASNQFGVKWASFDFQKDVLQGGVKNGVPLGAGPYAAANRNFSAASGKADFYNSNAVYFKANEEFLLGAPKIKKLCYQYISSNNALNALSNGSVHFVTPQLTKTNKDQLNGMKNKGIESVSTRQLGYGYVGINAGLVKNIYLRRAIMSAMNPNYAINYYSGGSAQVIYWPMSVVNWAYPKDGDTLDMNNGHDYAMFNDDQTALANIRRYMDLAGVKAGDSSLSVKFTIAGSNITEHPTYDVFTHAEELLEQCGWDISIVPDAQALTKLSTGSLAVWAAAWGSTIDPDMYQVYHKNSKATSVIAWGYREIIANNTDTSEEENKILTQLSVLIDDARKIDGDDTALVREQRSAIYKDAMKFVLDLAVELPIYQRDTLYAYNANVIDTNTLPAEINPYSSPLGRIWEVDFVK